MLLVYSLLLLIIRCVITQPRRPDRFGFYRRQDLEYNDEGMTKIMDYIHKEINDPLIYQTIGIYTKLVAGMEYTIFYMTYTKNTDSSLLIYKQQFFIPSSKKLQVEETTKLRSKGLMKIHDLKYIKIHSLISAWAYRQKIKFHYVSSIEIFPCNLPSINLFYYIVYAKLHNDSSLRKLIIEEEASYYSLIMEIV